MGYSSQVIARARQRLEQQKADRESQNRQALAQAYTQVPRLKEIDSLLRRSMAVAAQAVFAEGGDIQATMEQVKAANLSLQQERKELIAANFAPGYLDETPICPICGGSGYLGSSMCTCLQNLCRQEQKKELTQLTCGQEQFGSFRLDYYPEQVDRTYGASPRMIMERNLQYCMRYAEHFTDGLGNLLFVGGTGLGKTFLSACIANAVTDKGFSVAYESAPQLFSKLEKNRFSPDEQSRQDAANFSSCDLLIIDDLGTEMPGQFVIAALYSLLNDRLLSGKPMVISTNLNADELRQRYSPQIASRLLGHFDCRRFAGEDIRIQKSRGL
jgi:DNA replication protein DnaC